MHSVGLLRPEKANVRHIEMLVDMAESAVASEHSSWLSGFALLGVDRASAYVFRLFLMALLRVLRPWWPPLLALRSLYNIKISSELQ